MDSLLDIAHLSKEEIQEVYLKHGDLGALAEYAIAKKQQSPLLRQELTLAELHEHLTKIAYASGSGSGETKRKILTGLLINCTPTEAKYLVKIVTGEMRIGSVQGLVELAAAEAFGRKPADVRQAMLVSDDIAQVVSLAKSDTLGSAMIKPLTPLSFMLSEVMFSASEIADYYHKPLVCEFKYDGVRLQLHKSGSEVKLFSRRLEDVTISFPEIADAAAGMDGDLILDGEAIAWMDGHPMHFQKLQRRLHRKSVTTELTKEIPVVFVPYDILYRNGQRLIDAQLHNRKRILYSLKHVHPIMQMEHKMVSTASEIEMEFERSKRVGHEGLVLKEPDSLYHPGKRGRYWAKLKRELETVDAIIVAAEYGHGKRAGTLSDYTFAVWDGSVLKTIGKAYSGLTDSEIAEMTSRLKDITIKDEGYRLVVRAEIVIEIAFDSVQKSDRHDSGYALRFPRIKQIRYDKRGTDADTIEKVRRIYDDQRLKSR
jgi:DNA ligase-1